MNLKKLNIFFFVTLLTLFVQKCFSTTKSQHFLQYRIKLIKDFCYSLMCDKTTKWLLRIQDLHLLKCCMDDLPLYRTFNHLKDMMKKQVKL